MTRRLRALAVCAVLVLAGCTAPTPAPPTTTPTDSQPSPQNSTKTGVRVVSGSLPVDANRTFNRVQALVGADYAGVRVVVRDLSGYKSADLGRIPFFRVLGVSNPSLDTDEPAGLTTLTPAVYLSPADAEPARLEQVLAHEFVHVAQVREDMVPWFGGLSLARVTLDERFARRALVEGGAVYVTDAYTRRYLPGVQLQSAHVAAKYANGSSGNRVVYSQYLFGFRYVNATIDDPARLPAVYDDPPETTENLLHPGRRDELAPLNVTVEDDAVDRVRSPTARAGELFARVVLRETAGKSTAVRAAAGWGNDRVVAFDTEPRRSIAWVTRWDTPADAAEFAAAARTLENQSTGLAYRTTRVDPTTVVVFGGTESFVETATASGNVTVTA
ncbi:MAG: hypothetical protein ABEJ88_04410 [Halobacterium sp.]